MRLELRSSAGIFPGATSTELSRISRLIDNGCSAADESAWEPARMNLPLMLCCRAFRPAATQCRFHVEHAAATGDPAIDRAISAGAADRTDPTSIEALRLADVHCRRRRSSINGASVRQRSRSVESRMHQAHLLIVPMQPVAAQKEQRIRRMSSIRGCVQPSPCSTSKTASAQSKMAIARVHPADAALIFMGRQITAKPLEGSRSRLVSFSIW